MFKKTFLNILGSFAKYSKVVKNSKISENVFSKFQNFIILEKFGKLQNVSKNAKNVEHFEKN